MKTAEKNAKQVQGASAKSTNAPKTENRPNITGKEAKQDEIKQDAKPAEVAKVEATQAPETKGDDTAAVDNQPANAAPEQKEQPVAEEAKADVKYFKPSLNLEQTLKSVGNLHRLTIQRLALITRIKTLEEFEVKLVEENDQLESNPYQGCKLIIKDDKGREFATNTPNLIRMVTQYIFDACHEKLAEIEANIVFPAN